MIDEKPKLTNAQIVALQEDHDYISRELTRLRVSYWEEYVQSRIMAALKEASAEIKQLQAELLAERRSLVVAERNAAYERLAELDAMFDGAEFTRAVADAL